MPTADDEEEVEETIAVIDPLLVAPPSEHGAPHVLRAFIVNDDPKITLAPSFLNDSEVDHLIGLAEGHWAQSAIGVGETAMKDRDMKNVKSAQRTSSSCMLRSAQTEVVRAIEERAALLAGIDVDYLERMNLVRYRPGETFKEHHDGGFRPKTVFIYLNDLPDDDEGETIFPKLGIQFVPRKGCAIMWSNIDEDGEMDMRMIHAGLPPKTAVKYGVNCFFNKQATKQWEVLDGDLKMDDDDTVPLKNEAEQWHTLDPIELEEQGRTGDQVPSDSSALRVLVVDADPKFSILPRFLTAAEVKVLLDLASSTITVGSDEDVLIENVQRRLCAAAGVPETSLEAFSFRKCTPEMVPDGLLRTRELGKKYNERFGRKTSYIFLNSLNDNQGGELRFPKRGLQVRPIAGCAVLWSNSTTAGAESLLNAHQGRPPTSGILYGVQCIFSE